MTEVNVFGWLFTEAHTNVSSYTGRSVKGVLLKVNMFLPEQAEVAQDWFSFCSYWAKVASNRY